MQKNPTHLQAILLMIVAATLWSIAGVFTRYLDAVNGFEITFWRSLFAAFFVIGSMLLQGPKRWVGRVRKLGALGFLSGCMWATMYCCFMISLSMTTVANTSIMESLAPLFTALLAWLILRQHIPARTWWVIAAACVGIATMFVGSVSALDSRGMFGMLIALAIPIAAAFNVIILKKAGHAIDLIPAVFVGGAVSALLMLPFSLPFTVSTNDLIILAMLGFFQLGFPCMLMVRASKSLRATELALLALLEVILAPIWAWLGAGEVPAYASILGGVVVLCALVFNELTVAKDE